ncbi:Heme/steroid binding domain containing hypothetical protein [Phytophthora palmivora]|uniref:Uncharacterized protein n=1 Tax=Phytophthora palmivora TaxID=4796 RepID=A0A2P4Y9Y3_9STRA|nr:Heme/steroid binding domain containing hypothetical protein [Phytophthora palmivora]
MSFLEEYPDNATLEGLTEQQQETLKKWEDKFKDKYPVVGKIINGGFLVYLLVLLAMFSAARI